jgi:hypothetical protein
MMSGPKAALGHLAAHFTPRYCVDFVLVPCLQMLNAARVDREGSTGTGSQFRFY